MPFVRFVIVNQAGEKRQDAILDPVTGVLFEHFTPDITRIRMPSGFTTFVAGSLDDVARRLDDAKS